MAHLWILCMCFFVERVVEGSYENSMIMTTVPKTTGRPDSHHIRLIPGTPYDWANYQTLYSTYYDFQNTNQRDALLYSCKVDYSRKVLYLYNRQSAMIEAIPNLDWRNQFASATQIVSFHMGVSDGYVKVAVDWVSHNIYWTDPMFRWIVVQPGNTNMTDVSLYKIIVKEDLEKPIALAVDSVGRSIYWSDIAKYPKIERASLTGKNREVIISTGLLLPMSIDVDVSGTARRIYWVDAARDTVESANLRGGERRIIKRVSHTEFYDVALFRNVLSVVDVIGNDVYFINKLNGQLVAKTYTSTLDSIWGICMYHEEVQPNMEDYCATANCSDICVNEEGQATCLCREGSRLQGDGPLCIQDTSAYHIALVFSDGSSIYLADIRSLAAKFSTYAHKSIYVSTVGEIKFMTLDMVDRKVIFATNTDIYFVNIDMVNPSAQRIISSQDTITGLSMDWQEKNIYLTSGQSPGRISVVSHEGDNMVPLQKGLDNPRDLKVLALETKMVWISGTSNHKTLMIELSNLDGTGRKTVVNGGSLTNPKSLDFDSHTNRLYWVDSGYIKRVYINGTGLDTLTTSSVSPNLFLLYQNYFVWTEDDSPISSTINTADVRNAYLTIKIDSFDDVGRLGAVAVLDQRLQPSQKGPCEADNGDCEQICLPLGRSRICECEYGFKKDANGLSCSCEPLEDNFILVTDWSHNKIYQVSLVSDDVRALDIEITGNPNAVIYEQTHKRVIWADSKDEMIHSSYLNGSDHKIVIYKGNFNAYVDRLAIDSTSGNLYYTSVSTASDREFTGVSVISPKGDNLDLVAGGYTPRDIVVDPKEGLMFWTDHGTEPTVMKANMDASSISVIVSQNIILPNGLAIDYEAKQLYLSDGHLNTIQKCTYSGYCSVLYTDVGAFLMDIELSGQYLYYTAWNKPYITKMHKDPPYEISRLASNAELGRLDSISIYNSSAEKQPVNDDCSPNHGLGDCSTLCLPTRYSRTCACQDQVSLWLNSNICNDIPMCSSNIQNGEITGTCTNLHNAECSFICDRFYNPATADSKITCLYGKWDVPNPCLFSEATTSAPAPSIVPIAVGVTVGVLILLIIIVLALVFICKRLKNRTQPPGPQELQTPCYGLDELTTVATRYAPLQSQRPDTTYDQIIYDEIEIQGTAAASERSNSECASISKQSTLASSREYLTLCDPSDYLQPITSTTTRKTSF